MKFDDTLWKRIFSETSQFLKDSHFGKEDINIDVNTGIQMFVKSKEYGSAPHPSVSAAAA